LASLKIKEDIGDKKGIANTLSNIGAIKELQKDYKEALVYHLSALRIRKELGDQRGISDSHNNIGNIYKEQGNYPEALKNHFTSLKIYEEIGNKSGIASSYNNLGMIYYAQGDSALLHGDKLLAITNLYPKALKNYFESLKIREEIGDKTGIAASFVNIGTVNIKLKKYSDANKYLNEALTVSQEIGNKKSIKDSYNNLSTLDSIQGDFKNAYLNYRMYIVYRDSLFNEENAEKSFQMQMQYEIEKDQLREAQEEEKRLKAIARRNQVEYSVIILIVLLVIGAIMLLGSLKVPPAFAQGLNFVSLLMVFESVLVFTDPWLDVITNGAPFKKLLVNILLAIFIFPLHRFMEKRFRKRLKLE
jgi:tetratricopeptide (TPR) repeat protein